MRSWLKALGKNGVREVVEKVVGEGEEKVEKEEERVKDEL